MMQLLPLSLLLASSQLLRTVAAIDCHKVVVDKVSWDISALAGEYEVYDLDDEASTNTTYLFNLCSALKRHEKKHRGDCKQGSWACAFRESLDEDVEETTTWSIAGIFVTDHGAHLEDHQYRLKGSKSHEDAKKEGLLLEYNGGRSPTTKGPVQMLMELECVREGDDGSEERRDDEDKPEGKGPQFISYKSEPLQGQKGEVADILRMKWETKYACEDEADKDDGETKASGGWGFFTWMIIILFLAVAAYLIFGSWLNYNRHGARGWDLLPHGDTIRDIPYLMKDWGRRVVGTVKGDGRGGYNQI